MSSQVQAADEWTIKAIATPVGTPVVTPALTPKKKAGLLSTNAVDSPKLMRRVLRSAGAAPPAESAESDEEDDEEEESEEIKTNKSGSKVTKAKDDAAEWSDEDDNSKKAHKAAHKAARKAESAAAQKAAAENAAAAAAAAVAASVATNNNNNDKSSSGSHTAAQASAPAVGSSSALSGADLLRWRRAHQIAFVRATAVHADVVTPEFQRSLLDLGIVDACVNVLLETPNDDFHATLCALGLLQRLPKSDVPNSMPLLARLCELSRDVDPQHTSIRALAIALLAAVEDKKLLDNLGVFSDCLSFARSDDARTQSPLVRHALAIALANFSLDQSRQVDVVTAIGMPRLVQWAKSLDAELKMCAAAIVANGVANPVLTQVTVYEGGLTILVKLFAAPGAPTFKEHAARGLANLSGHTEAQLPMVERGVLPLLARVILEQPSPSFDIMRSALRCMSYLAASPATAAAVGEFVARSPQFGERVDSVAKGDNAELAKHARKIVEELAATAGHPVTKKTALTALGRMATRRPSLDDLDAWHLSKKNPEAAPTASQLKQGEKAVVKRRVKRADN